ncbi:MAG TPA: hypothetical protein VFF81_06975 [Noviherbaspirillum sp.]|nr:hypothetical protein [Noviherbaspirillum sp.]
MPTLSFKVSFEEEAAIRYRMMVAGETNLSRHLREICLGEPTQNDEQLGRMHEQIGYLTETVHALQNLMRQQARQKDGDVELRLMAGLYMMLYRSVEPEVQALVDRYLDATVIENFLGADQGFLGKKNKPASQFKAEVETPNSYLAGRGKRD